MKWAKTKWYIIGFIISFLIVLAFKIIDAIWVFKELSHTKTYHIIHSVFLFIWLFFMTISIIDGIKSFKDKK